MGSKAGVIREIIGGRSMFEDLLVALKRVEEKQRILPGSGPDRFLLWRTQGWSSDL